MCGLYPRDSCCVRVETPADLLMMEQAQCYRGQYFVLMGGCPWTVSVHVRSTSTGSPDAADDSRR